MKPQSIRLTPATRHFCVQAVLSAPDGYWFIQPKKPARSTDQNARLHAMFSDIARQHTFFGEKRDAETVKRLMVDAFARVKTEMGEPVQQGNFLPSLDGKGVVQLGIQTRRFSKALMAEFISYLHAWGVDNGVMFSDPVDVPGWHQERGTP